MLPLRRVGFHDDQDSGLGVSLPPTSRSSPSRHVLLKDASCGYSPNLPVEVGNQRAIAAGPESAAGAPGTTDVLHMAMSHIATVASSSVGTERLGRTRQWDE